MICSRDYYWNKHTHTIIHVYEHSVSFQKSVFETEKENKIFVLKITQRRRL